MEYHSPYTIDIPVLDIPTFIFSAGDKESRKSPQYFDAENPALNYSLNEAEILVKRVAKGLQTLGLRPDDKVLLYAGNRVYFPVLLWGTLAAGCVFTGCAPSASVHELVYQLQDSGAKLVLAGAESALNALEAAKTVGLAADKVFIFCDVGEEARQAQPCGLKPWTAFWASPLEVLSWDWKKITTIEAARSTTAVINYSSGTTGLPKGVECSHYNLISNAEQVLHKRLLVANTSEGEARKRRLRFSGDRWLASIPMYHAYGQAYFCINAARSGAKVFVMKKFTIDRYLLFMDIYRINYMAAVPTIIVMLSKEPSASAYNFLSVEQVVSGSAPLSKEIGSIVEKRLLRPGVQIKQGWGMTECTCSATGFAPDDESDGGAVGWLNANMSAKIVPLKDNDFGSVSSGAQISGEIWISGPNIMKGYFKKPKETRDTIVYEGNKRWLRTGDIGYFDSLGCLYIVDRLKELIKVKGLQVAPAELEAVLLLHPEVQDAAVGAVKVGNNEYPKGYVVRKSDKVSAKELEKWVQERCSPHKWLAGGISFINEVPRTASGKVKRRELPLARAASRRSNI